MSLLLAMGIFPLSGYAELTASVSTPDASSFFPGEIRYIKIQLANNAVVPITGTTLAGNFLNPLADGLILINTPPDVASTTCGGTMTAIAGSKTFSMAGATVPAEGTCFVLIPFTATTTTGAAKTYTYELEKDAVQGMQGPDAVSNGQAVAQGFNSKAIAKPVISKSFGADTIALGGSSTTLTMSVTNPNGVKIDNFTIADSFPSTIKVAASPAATASCDGGLSATFNPAPVAGDTSIKGAAAVLPANGTCTFTVNVEGRQTNGKYSDLQQNEIPATGLTTDLGLPAAGPARASITVESPLKVSKDFSSKTLSHGSSGSLVIRLENSSGSSLPITSFSDTPIDGTGGANVSKGLLVTGASSTCGGTTSHTAEGVTLAGGSIPANGFCTINVSFTGRVQSNRIPVSYNNVIAEGKVVTSPGIVSREASASILVADDLRVLKTATPVAVAPGNPIKYEITVQNFSAAPISNVTVKDSFTQGQTYLNGGSYQPVLSPGCGVLTDNGTFGGSMASFVIGNLPARSNVSTPGICTITMWAMTDKDGNGVAKNTINPGDVCYDGGLTCNTGGAPGETSVNNAAVLSAVKKFADYAAGETSFNEGTIVRMTVTLTNRSANPLTNVTISDPFQPNAAGDKLIIAAPANAASTCGTPIITAVPNSNSIVMNGATVPARADNGAGANGSCILQVDVVGAAGVYSNVADISGTETLGNGQTRTVAPVATTAVGVAFRSALTANKNFNPVSIASGGKSTVTVQLANGSALPLSNVTFTDPFPAGMVLATPHKAYTTCAGAPVIGARAGDNKISLSGATIHGNGNCSLLFDVIATGNANWINTIPAKGITADGGVSNVTAATATLLHEASTNLTMQKNTNPSSLTFPGQVSFLTIEIASGTQAVTNMGVTDYFTTDGLALHPGNAYNGWLVAAKPEASTTCVGGDVVAVPGSRSVSLSIAELAANTNCTITVNVTSSVSGGVNNIIPAGALKTDQGLTNSGPATTSLAVSANVGIVKNFTPNVVKPGERSRLRITFYNPTAQAATNVAVTDNLPATVVVPSNPNPTTTCNGTVSWGIAGGVHQVTLAGGNIAAANGLEPASCQIEIDVLVAASGDYINTIPAGALSATVGGATVNNTVPTSDTLRAKSPLTVHKAFSSLTLDNPPPAAPTAFSTGTDSKTPGAVAVLTLRFENSNNTDLTGLSVSDILPPGLVVAPVPAASTSCIPGTVIATGSATSIRLSGATLKANSVCTVSVNVLSNVPGSYTNDITAGAVTTAEGVVNDAPTSARLIVSTPPTVNKQFSPVVIPPNDISRLTIFLTNENSTAMTLTADMDDVLPVAPGQIKVAALPAVATTCGGGVAAVTAAAGATTVQLKSGATIPAQTGCTIEVNVTGVIAGVYNNNIPAGSLQTNLGNNPLPANAPLSISTRGYISGKVFKDNNVVPNGTFESGTDTPIANTAVELRGGANCSGPLLATVNTDAVGNYVFTDLPAASYSICQVIQPTGTVNGIATAGAIIQIAGSTGTPGVASNPTATSSQIANIILNANGAGEVSGSINNNFAEVAASSISGKVFKDKNTPNGTFEGGVDDSLAGVTIQLLNSANAVIATTLTDVDGNYSFDNLLPGTYSVLEPVQPAGTANGITTAGAVANGGTPGTATTPAVTPSKISNIVLPPNTSSSANNFAEEARGGATGVVYDAVTRQPVAGATVSISGPAGFDASTQVVGGSATSVTGADGLYQFLLNSNAPNGTYTLAITTYPAGYVPASSTMLPVCSNSVLIAPTPDPALVQPAVTAPTTAVPQQNPAACAATSGSLNVRGLGTTSYYFSFNFSNASGPTKSANVGNNHIPLDPILGGAIVMTKSTPLVNVVRGDLVPYTITATNTLNALLTNINVVDTIPAGFRYRIGSASLNGVHTEPQVIGRNLNWPNQTFNAGERKTWRMLLVVGTGVSEGEYVNRVAALNNIANSQVSNTATATVRVVPDPTFDCSDIIGKVFDDKNANGYQDQGEPGIANVRIATARGLLVTSDQDGRFHVACAAIPNADRGSNFVMKLDERTLPSGYRITTENPRDVRVTRGKMVKLNFGATVHRVIRLDISGAAFMGDSAELQPSYLAELKKLPEQLQTRPSVLRIAYRRGAESADLANKRMDIVKEQIKELWHKKREQGDEKSEALVPLMIETEMELAQ